MHSDEIPSLHHSEDLRSRPLDLAHLGDKPEDAVWMSWQAVYSTSSEKVAAYQLAGLRTRFREMSARLPMLGALAREQGITDIRTIEDGAPLLFRHNVYKSYPLSFLERNQFGRLTTWLGSFTLHDLSRFDAKGLDSIDSWIVRLNEGTPMRLIHTSGTSGKLSFLPRSTQEVPLSVRGWQQNFAPFGNEPNRIYSTGLRGIPMIFPGNRHGATSPHRLMEAFVDVLYDGDESMIVALHPERLNPDLVSFSGRFAAAEAKGDIGREQISPALLAMVETARRQQAEAPHRMEQFIATIMDRYRGRRVMFAGYWAMLYDLAITCRKLGVNNLFRPDSLLWAAGGLKGKVYPDGFKKMILEVLGAPIQEGYGMSETVTVQPACPEGNYHLAPWTIVYVLDPTTGAPTTREGVHTGRLGIMDLAAVTYWGGILSGDEVTVSFGDTEPCPCGRQGPYMFPDIRRYSEKEGGDDKIACAGVPQALDRALDFLNNLG